MSFISEELLQFVIQNQEKDSYQLALQRDRYPSSFFDRALPAIQARQKLSKKIPLWASNPEIFISDPTIVEQASSWETSEYKASLIPLGTTVLDLTGGMGSDTYAMARRAERVLYLEFDIDRVEAARHNFRVLGAHNITVHHGRAEVEGIRLAEEYRPDVLFIDPDRRPTDAHYRRFTLQDSRPDITTLLPRLRTLLPNASILLKLSPMMDLTQALHLLGADCDVHVVGMRRDAKELLLHYHPAPCYCYTAVELMPQRCLRITSSLSQDIAPLLVSEKVGAVLYDLYPSVSKLGYHNFVLPYTVWQPDKHTHLLFAGSSDAWQDFPGRAFQVLESGVWDKKVIRQITRQPLHLIAKNFPVPTDRLRTQLKVREGGELFLFAYTDYLHRSRFVVAQPL